MRVLLKDRIDNNLTSVEVTMADARDAVDCEGEYYNVGSCVRLEDSTGDEIWIITPRIETANTIVTELFHNDKADLTQFAEHTYMYPTLEEDDEDLKNEVID